MALVREPSNVSVPATEALSSTGGGEPHDPLDDSQKGRPVSRQSGVQAFAFNNTGMTAHDFLDDDDDDKDDGTSGGCRAAALHPFSTLRRSWNFAVFLIVVYNVIIIPARYVFPDTEGAVADGIFYFLDYFGDAMLITDVVWHCYVGFSDLGVVVSDLAAIRWRYFKSGRMLLDVIAVIPIDLIFLPGIRPRYLYRINRFVRLYRFPGYFFEWERGSSTPRLFRLLKMVAIFALMVHWMACAFYTIVEMDYNDPLYNVLDGSYDRTFYLRWDMGMQLYINKPFSESYPRALFYAVTLIGGVGPGYGAAPSNRVLTFMLISVLFGVLVVSAVVSTLSGIMLQSHAAHQQFRERFATVTSWLGVKGVTTDTNERVRRYYRYLWRRSVGIEDEVIMADMPPHLRMRLFKDMVQGALTRVSMFEACDDIGFLNELTASLKSQIYGPGDYIIHEGEMGAEMYFITKGEVQVLVKGVGEVNRLGRGKFFGDVALLLKAKRNASIRASTFVNVLMLEKADVDRALIEFPSYAGHIYDLAEARSKLDQNAAARAAALKSASGKDLPSAGAPSAASNIPTTMTTQPSNSSLPPDPSDAQPSQTPPRKQSPNFPLAPLVIEERNTPSVMELTPPPRSLHPGAVPSPQSSPHSSSHHPNEQSITQGSSGGQPPEVLATGGGVPRTRPRRASLAVPGSISGNSLNNSLTNYPNGVGFGTVPTAPSPAARPSSSGGGLFSRPFSAAGSRPFSRSRPHSRPGSSMSSNGRPMSSATSNGMNSPRSSLNMLVHVSDKVGEWISIAEALAEEGLLESLPRDELEKCHKASLELMKHVLTKATAGPPVGSKGFNATSSTSGLTRSRGGARDSTSNPTLGPTKPPAGRNRSSAGSGTSTGGMVRSGAPMPHPAMSRQLSQTMTMVARGQQPGMPRQPSMGRQGSQGMARQGSTGPGAKRGAKKAAASSRPGLPLAPAAARLSANTASHSGGSGTGSGNGLSSTLGPDDLEESAAKLPEHLRGGVNTSDKPSRTPPKDSVSPGAKRPAGSRPAVSPLSLSRASTTAANNSGGLSQGATNHVKSSGAGSNSASAGVSRSRSAANVGIASPPEAPSNKGTPRRTNTMTSGSLTNDAPSAKPTPRRTNTLRGGDASNKGSPRNNNVSGSAAVSQGVTPSQSRTMSRNTSKVKVKRGPGASASSAGGGGGGLASMETTAELSMSVDGPAADPALSVLHAASQMLAREAGGVDSSMDLSADVNVTTVSSLGAGGDEAGDTIADLPSAGALRSVDGHHSHGGHPHSAAGRAASNKSPTPTNSSSNYPPQQNNGSRAPISRNTSGDRLSRLGSDNKFEIRLSRTGSNNSNEVTSGSALSSARPGHHPIGGAHGPMERRISREEMMVINRIPNDAVERVLLEDSYIPSTSDSGGSRAMSRQTSGELGQSNISQTTSSSGPQASSAAAPPAASSAAAGRNATQDRPSRQTSRQNSGDRFGSGEFQFAGVGRKVVSRTNSYNTEQTTDEPRSPVNASPNLGPVPMELEASDGSAKNVLSSMSSDKAAARLFPNPPRRTSGDKYAVPSGGTSGLRSEEVSASEEDPSLIRSESAVAPRRTGLKKSGGAKKAPRTVSFNGVPESPQPKNRGKN